MTSDAITLRAGHRLRTLATYLAWPLLTGTFIWLYVSIADASDARRYMQSSGGLLILSGAFMATWIALERILPFRAGWNGLGRQEMNDLLHYAGGIAFPEELARATLYALLPLIVLWTPQLHTSWPISLPFVVQTAAALALHELGEYTYHRLAHRLPTLWKFHRLHHTSQRLNLTKGFRHNVVDRLLNGTILGATMIIVGVPASVLIWVSAIYTATGISAHANVEVRFPSGFDAVFNNPRVHRIHHAVDPAGGKSNFGGVVMIWDILFGTFQPSNRYNLAEVGIENNSLPVGFWGQYFSFLRWDELDRDPIKQPGCS